jgi:hypothetical protein
MQFDGALIKEQGVTFAIVVVKTHVIQNSIAANEAVASFQPFFPGVPIILMAQDSHGIPTYWGRKDIVRFLASIDPRRIPWKRYSE